MGPVVIGGEHAPGPPPVLDEGGRDGQRPRQLLSTFASLDDADTKRRRVERFVAVGLVLDGQGHVPQAAGWRLLGVALDLGQGPHQLDRVLQVHERRDV